MSYFIVFVYTKSTYIDSPLIGGKCNYVLNPLSERGHTFIFPMPQNQSFGHSKVTENPFMLYAFQISSTSYVVSKEYFYLKILTLVSQLFLYSPLLSSKTL